MYWSGGFDSRKFQNVTWFLKKKKKKINDVFDIFKSGVQESCVWRHFSTGAASIWSKADDGVVCLLCSSGDGATNATLERLGRLRESALLRMSRMLLLFFAAMGLRAFKFYKGSLSFLCVNTDFSGLLCRDHLDS